MEHMTHPAGCWITPSLPVRGQRLPWRAAVHHHPSPKQARMHTLTRLSVHLNVPVSTACAHYCTTCVNNTRGAPAACCCCCTPQSPQEWPNLAARQCGHWLEQPSPSACPAPASCSRQLTRSTPHACATHRLTGTACAGLLHGHIHRRMHTHMHRHVCGFSPASCCGVLRHVAGVSISCEHLRHSLCLPHSPQGARRQTRACRSSLQLCARLPPVPVL